MFNPIRRRSSHPWLRKSWPLEETLVIITNLCRSSRLPDQECLYCSLQHLIAQDWPSCWGYYAECAWAKGNHPWPMASACFMVLHAPSSGYTLTLRHTFGNTSCYTSGYTSGNTSGNTSSGHLLSTFWGTLLQVFHSSTPHRGSLLWSLDVRPGTFAKCSEPDKTLKLCQRRAFRIIKVSCGPYAFNMYSRKLFERFNAKHDLYRKKKLQQQELALKKLWRRDL